MVTEQKTFQIKAGDVIPIIMSMVGLMVGAFFVIMQWLDGWIYFSVLVVGMLLIINQNFGLVPIGMTGMFSSGVFTKMGWLDPIVYFSAFILAVLILAQQIVTRQMGAGE